MKRNAYGRMVNVSSALGSLPYTNGGISVFGVSKVALNGLTKKTSVRIYGNQHSNKFSLSRMGRN